MKSGNTLKEDKMNSSRQKSMRPRTKAENNTVAIELVRFFKKNRERLCLEWTDRMKSKGLLEGLSTKEIKSESEAIYDTCVTCLESGEYSMAQDYAKRMAERGVLQGMTAEQIMSGLLVLRDVYGRSMFEAYRTDFPRLLRALDVYEPVANQILIIVSKAFLDEREKTVRKAQDAVRELSIPVLMIRQGLLILPIIGMVDSLRAKQLTENLLKAIRDNRARVALIDITGVPIVDSKVANHIMQTVEAAGLMGATVVITGISPEIAQTLVTIGVDVTRFNALGDLMRGMEEADRLLGIDNPDSESKDQ
jgi:rsbT co-antagonist protein RsbR